MGAHMKDVSITAASAPPSGQVDPPLLGKLLILSIWSKLFKSVSWSIIVFLKRTRSSHCEDPRTSSSCYMPFGMILADCSTMEPKEYWPVLCVVHWRPPSSATAGLSQFNVASANIEVQHYYFRSEFMDNGPQSVWNIDKWLQLRTFHLQYMWVLRDWITSQQTAIQLTGTAQSLPPVH